jgi:ATP-dependent protease ClpP protease subunit
MAKKPIVDMWLLQALNPEYTKALWRGEKWALDHAKRCESLNAGEPEGFRRPFDGKPRKWCGAACTSPEGCVMCTLPENPEMARLNREHKAPQDAAREGVITVSGHVDQKMAADIRLMLDIAKKNGAKKLEVRIESSGGEVRSGLKIYEMIRSAPVQKRVGIVRYYALSMATIILQACDYRIASPSARFLIHDTRFEHVTLGTLKDAGKVGLMVALSELDEKYIRDILTAKTKRSLAEIKALEDKDIQISSEEALKFGLIDTIRA